LLLFHNDCIDRLLASLIARYDDIDTGLKPLIPWL